MTRIAQPTAAAIHEAGHAVASVAFGLTFKGVRVHRSRGRVGEGVVYGTLRRLNLFHMPTMELEARAVRELAGAYAEARRRRVSAVAILLTTASEDYRSYRDSFLQALVLRVAGRVLIDGNLTKLDGEEIKELEHLVGGMVEHMTHDFVRRSWRHIVTLAAALDRRGFLTAAEVRAEVAA